MNALAFTPWFSLLVRVLTAFLVIYLSWRTFSRLRNVSQASKATEQPEGSKDRQQSLAQTIELLLPQTQCGQCGYEGCAPYAKAIANGDAINKCPPGGDRTVRNLADLLHLPVVALDPEHGETTAPSVAYIREAECIGCTKCIQACPVDAIVGAAKLMHTVIAGECTGCDLCVAPCPVDCIDMLPVPDPNSAHWQLPHRSASKGFGTVEGFSP